MAEPPQVPASPGEPVPAEPVLAAPAPPAPPPNRSRMILTVSLLCGSTLLAQFLLPVLVKRLLVPWGILGGIEVEAQQVNNAARYRGRVWYVRNVASGYRGNLTQVVSLPVGGGEPQVTGVLPMVEPWLLAGPDRLWVFSAADVAEVRDGQVQVLTEASGLRKTSRPFLYGGLPAVLDAHAAGHSLLVWRDGHWDKDAEFTIVIDGARQDVANEELQAFQVDGELHLFCRPSAGPIYYRRGLPGKGLEDDPAWRKVVDLGFLQQWRAIPVDGAPRVFYHDDRRSGGPFIVGLRPDGPEWKEFFTHPVGADIGLGALPGGEGEDFILLRRILPLGVEVLGVSGGQVAWRHSESGGLGLSSWYRVWSNAPRLIPPLLTLILAVILSFALPRLKVTGHAAAARTVRFASPVRRALAAVVDTAILTAPLVLFGYSTISDVLARPSLGAIFSAAARLLCVGSFWLIVVFFAVSLMEGLWGRTPGKWLTGIRVVRMDLSKPGFGWAALRNLVRPVDAVLWYLVGLLFVGLTQRWQRLGDMAAGTIVVRNRPEPGSAPPAG